MNLVFLAWNYHEKSVFGGQKDDLTQIYHYFIDYFHTFNRFFKGYDTQLSWNLMKKGVQIKSYLISYGLIRPGFKIWKHIHLYTHQGLILRILYCKCLNLYLVFVKIYLIRIKCLGGGRWICIQTARRRCVLKIYWLSRLKIFGPQRVFFSFLFLGFFSSIFHFKKEKPQIFQHKKVVIFGVPKSIVHKIWHVFFMYNTIGVFSRVS